MKLKNLSSVLMALTLPLSLHASADSLCATPAKDGDPAAVTGILNTYYSSPAGSLSAGATSITLGSSKAGATTDVSAGDLLMIIQMQNATIDSSNSSNYGGGNGSGSGYLSTTAGTYEYVVATASGTAGSSVPIRGLGAGGGLVNSYVNSAYSATQGQATYQIVRVPQYGNAALSGTITAAPWNGVTGGIVALDATNNLNWGGSTIDLSGLGFRGGAGQFLRGTVDPAYAGADPLTDWRSPVTVSINGNKGEGIAGTPRYVSDSTSASWVLDTGVEGYPDGSRGRGAPGNAGGGATDGQPSGNGANAGGGGGANGGSGGQGGNSYSNDLVVGGLGGRATPFSLSQLFLGGGGGSASRNNDITNGASRGGNGGGMVFVRAASSTGSANINVNGTDGVTGGSDSGGGGGAGGTVVVQVADGSGSLSINAQGGNGGNGYYTYGTPDMAHGPGGGGGGGVVYTNVTGATANTSGGTHGNTTATLLAYNSTNGTQGSLGTISGTIPGLSGGDSCPVLTVAKSTSTPTVWAGATGHYTIKVTNTGAASNALQITDALPTGLTLVPNTITVDPSNSRVSSDDVLTPAAAPANLTLQKFSLGYGSSLSLSFDVQTPANNDTNQATYQGTTFQNSATASATDKLDTAGNPISATYDSGSSTAEDIKLLFLGLTLNKTVQNITQNTSVSSTTTQGYPKDVLEYCIAYTNDGDGDLNNVAVNDGIPDYSVYLPDAYGAGYGVQNTPPGDSATLLTSASDTDAGTLDATTGLSLTVGTLAKGASGQVCFRTQIQ